MALAVRLVTIWRNLPWSTTKPRWDRCSARQIQLKPFTSAARPSAPRKIIQHAAKSEFLLLQVEFFASILEKSRISLINRSNDSAQVCKVSA